MESMVNRNNDSAEIDDPYDPGMPFNHSSLHLMLNLGEDLGFF